MKFLARENLFVYFFCFFLRCEKTIEHAEFDVIGLLNVCSRCNADQLRDWCLHFISSNYAPMSKRPEFENLTEDHRAYIEEHQWPPKTYYESLDK